MTPTRVSKFSITKMSKFSIVKKNCNVKEKKRKNHCVNQISHLFSSCVPIHHNVTYIQQFNNQNLRTDYSCFL